MAALSRLAAALLLLCGAAGAAHAQRAPHLLDPAHWSADALRRLGGMGLLPPAADPVMAPLGTAHVRRALEHAQREADARGLARVAALVDAYIAWLDEEADTAAVRAAGRLVAGWQATEGEALAGDGYFPEEDWEGARPLPALNAPVALVSARGHLSERFAWSIAAGRSEERWSVPAATAAAALGPFDVWGGRRRLHYGVGRGGATVLGAGAWEPHELTQRALYSFDGVGIHVREPFHFPGFLRVLGPARVEAVGGRLPRNGNVERPWVVFGRLVGHPFTPRLTLGVNRGAIFGGEGNRITTPRMLGLLIGLHGGEGGEFENQVFSTVARFRPPLGPLPLELYLEWGMDDTAGAVRDTPGIVAGVDLAAVPGLPGVALGLERTSFPESCCGNPIWYRSVFFRGSWADEGRLFAHPIGGHGSEWLAHVTVDLPGRGLLVRARALTRERGEENLFAPGREGRSYGGGASVEYRLAPATRLRLDAALEDGAGWTARRASLLVAHAFARLLP